MTPNEQMPPNLRTLLDQVKLDIFSTLNCHQIGKIEKVTSSENTVEVQIQIRRVASDGSSTEYPVLVDCPYFILGGGGAYLDFPISAGDYCIVLFNDRNIDNWWKTGAVMDPGDFRKHSFSDAIALVGIHPSSSPLAMDGSFVRLLGKSGPGAEQPAARETDAIGSTSTDDSVFWAWIAAAGAYLSAMGVAAPIPTSLTGKITGGSSEVKIG